MERLFKISRDGRSAIFTADEVLEDLRTDLDNADPGEAVPFPAVEPVIMTEKEYETLPEFDGW